MAPPPVAVLDTLNSLLEAELNSIFRFMGEGSPYLTRATAQVRRPLALMVRDNERHSRELSEWIERLGGSPTPRLRPRPGDQYLAYLSLNFLLPKLVGDKRLLIRRYENALAAVEERPDIHSSANELLRRLLNDHKNDLQVLGEAVSELTPHR